MAVVQKLETKIEGFDHISNGGLPRGRTTLVCGTAGSAKTVFAAQFLAEGIQRAGESGVFITFEESADDIRANLLNFGWDIAKWEAENRWVFVDASPRPDEEHIVVGEFDLTALMARIEHAINKVGAKRVSIDSLGAIFHQLNDTSSVRRGLFAVSSTLKKIGVTALITAERIHEYGEISRHGVEEFVADNVIILRNVLESERRRRTIEILKYRGTNHAKGEFPFTITATGIVVLPLSALELKQRSSNVRITSGNRDLDVMCDGGFFRDSVILISGATGTGKTLMASQFLAASAESNQRALLFAFEESREQLFRNGRGWGFDLEKMERDGNVRVLTQYPEVMSLEDHLLVMKRAIEEFKPVRIAVDSLSALERMSNTRTFREFVLGLTSFIKHQEMAGIFTSTTPSLMGGTSVTEAHISTITDSIILLRYVEMYGEMRRGLTVLKMRGSMHDKDIREFNIDSSGMHLGKPFRQVTGILSGAPRYTSTHELDALGGLFTENDN